MPAPAPPGPGEIVVRPEVVGICGSDLHLVEGHLEHVGVRMPVIQGHEIAATVDAVGEGVQRLAPGDRVAVFPLSWCGECSPCRAGRGNVCDRFQIIGVHADGGLQERLRLPAEKAYPIAAALPVAALAEPVSIAVRSVNRGRVVAGERAVVLGAGPIGQAITVAARDRGLDVLAIDPLASRLALSRALGAETLAWSDAPDVVDAARDWSGGEGPPVVFDATGAADAIRAAVDMAASAARVVIVGMSGAEVALRVGSFTEKELDVLGVSCCDADEFAEAVALVERRAAALARMITHEFPLERAGDALAFAIENPSEVMKVVITGF
ncbi:MAG: alcohol dehydrogenase catalytic domain-containing protein [Solirubrobacteraceae bacterium]